MLDLYKNIKKYRELKNMSQEELAKKVGYSNRSAIARIEKSEIDLPQSKIVAIADALGVPAGTLMGSTEIDTDDILYAEIKAFNEVQKQMLADQIEFIKKYGNERKSRADEIRDYFDEVSLMEYQKVLHQAFEDAQINYLLKDAVTGKKTFIQFNSEEDIDNVDRKNQKQA